MAEEKALKKAENGIQNVEKANSKETPSELPEEFAEALQDMPPRMRRSITMEMMQTSLRGSFSHPLVEKLTEEHIDKFLDNSQKDNDNEYKYKSSNRWFYLMYSALGIALFVFLIIFLLPQNEDLLLDIFKLLVAFIGGLGSGYGLKSLRK